MSPRAFPPAQPTPSPTPATSEHLRATLDQLARPGAPANAAFDRLVADYARFHLVLAVLALAFLAAAVAATVVARRNRRAVPKGTGRRFERATWSVALVASVGFALLMGLLVAANTSTVIDPLPGFRGSIPAIADAPPGSAGARTDEAFDRWLQSGEYAIPAGVRAAVDQRLSWQRPKAIISAVLLVLVCFASRWLWRSILARTRRPDHRWGAGDLGRLAAALASVAVGLLLALMVMGNTQASLAPISMTLFYG
ncbi:MAG: hypothetical protein ACTHN0_18690 [Aquihabitans sp.]